LSGVETLTFGANYSTVGAQNNVNLTATSSVRYTGGSAATFTGIIAGTSNVAGEILTLHNASSSTLTLANQSASSTATNRVITGTGSDLVMAANSSVVMQYDGTTNMWRVIGGSGGGIPAGTTGQIQYNSGSNSFAADASFTYTTPGVVGIGTAAGSTGILKMSGTTSGTVSIQPAAVAGTYNFILPTNAGTAGQPLLSNAGASAMAFGTLNYAGGGTGTTTQFTTGSVVFAGASGIYTQDNTKLFWDDTNFRLGIGTATPTQGLTVFGNIDAGGTNGYLTEIANAGTTGTTVNKLAKLNTSGAAIISAITDIDGMLGIVVGETAGGTSAVTTGNAQIATSGQASCIFDGQTVPGDYVSISATVAGDCLDGGTSRPVTNQTIGRVLTANSGVGTAATVAIGLSGSGTGGVPTGTIMAFAGTCPAGWTEYTAARGRFLRGIDNGAGNDPDGTRTAGAVQADMLASHTHTVNVANTAQNTGNNYMAGGVNTPTGTATTSATGGSETRPKNVAVTFCQYQGGSPLTTTASGATNYVARFTSPTTLGTGTMYDSGSAVGVGTASPQNLLDVNGAASIGYNVAAPTNGLIVSGNVGIGTTNPLGTLHVRTATNGNFLFYAGTQMGTPTGELQFTNDAASANNPLLITASAIDFNTPGGVGIGTTLPAQTLHIHSASGSNHGGIQIDDRGDGCCAQFSMVDSSARWDTYVNSGGAYYLYQVNNGSGGGVGSMAHYYQRRQCRHRNDGTERSIDHIRKRWRSEY
jgi:hypothetical protein